MFTSVIVNNDMCTSFDHTLKYLKYLKVPEPHKRSVLEEKGQEVIPIKEKAPPVKGRGSTCPFVFL